MTFFKWNDFWVLSAQIWRKMNTWLHFFITHNCSLHQLVKADVSLHLIKFWSLEKFHAVMNGLFIYFILTLWVAENWREDNQNWKVKNRKRGKSKLTKHTFNFTSITNPLSFDEEIEDEEINESARDFSFFLRKFICMIGNRMASD